MTVRDHNSAGERTVIALAHVPDKQTEAAVQSKEAIHPHCINGGEHSWRGDHFAMNAREVPNSLALLVPYREDGATDAHDNGSELIAAHGA